MTQPSVQFAVVLNDRPALFDQVAIAVDNDIRDFLDGENDGCELFDALYGDVADEPIPQRLTALLRG